MGEIRDLAISFLDWLPLDRAAKNLSIALNQELTEVDLLGFARQQLLTLSVRFPNLVKVRYGEIIHYPRSQLDSAKTLADLPEELKWLCLSPEEARSLPDFPQEAEGEPVLVIRLLKLGADHYVKFTGRVKTIEGVWDLPMIGGEMLGVENEFQRLRGYPPISLWPLEGVIVRGSDGTLSQLQCAYSFAEYSAVWDGIRRYLKQRIANGEIKQKEGKRLLDLQKEERKRFLKMVRELPASECYYPAGYFPDDSNFVVRMDALLEFEKFAKNRELSSHPPPIELPQHSFHQNRCKPVCAEQIKRYFRVKADQVENAEWWKAQMRNASRNGLAECREGAGRTGPGGSTWCPDAVAGWLVDRYKKGLEGLSEKSAWAALRKFPGCEEAADYLYPLDGE
jgi:hypothetical protein